MMVYADELHFIIHTLFLALFEQTNYNSHWRCDMDHMTLKEASEKWGVTPRRINYLCAAGHKGLYGPMGTGLLITPNGDKLSTIISCIFSNIIFPPNFDLNFLFFNFNLSKSFIPLFFYNLIKLILSIIPN